MGQATVLRRLDPCCALHRQTLSPRPCETPARMTALGVLEKGNRLMSDLGPSQPCAQRAGCRPGHGETASRMRSEHHRCGLGDEHVVACSIGGMSPASFDQWGPPSHTPCEGASWVAHADLDEVRIGIHDSTSQTQSASPTAAHRRKHLTEISCPGEIASFLGFQGPSRVLVAQCQTAKPTRR